MSESNLRETLKKLIVDRFLLSWLVVAGLVFFAIYISWASPAWKEAAQIGAKAASAAGVDAEVQAKITETLATAIVRQEQKHFLQELFLHLGVSALVAAALIFAVEGYSKLKLHQEMQQHREYIARDVWSAIFKRRVDELVAEALDRLASMRVVKRDVMYTITLHRPPDGTPGDCVALERSLEYKIENIAPGPTRHTIRSRLSSEHGVQTLTIGGYTGIVPGHSLLRVGGRAESLGNLVREEKGETPAIVLEKEIELADGGEPIKVELEGWTLLPVSRRMNDYVQLVPVVGLSVTLINRYPERILNPVVEFFHTQKGREVRQAHNGRPQRFSEAYLPGQFFMISWDCAPEASPQAGLLPVQVATPTLTPTVGQEPTKT